MSTSSPTLEDRFVGCLLGLALGDSFGAPFVGQSVSYLTRRFLTSDDLLRHPIAGTLYYTDDTQMAVGVAETLAACGRIDDEELCRRFAANYAPDRGYGRGARVVLEAMAAGDDHRSLARNYFPGGSYGNGAAMRVAPVGLMFRHDHDRLWEEARLSALPTHTHPLGIEGAQVLALAVGIASSLETFDRQEFCERLAARCTSLEYSEPLRRAASISDPRDLALFGNGIQAQSSVVTAIAAFALTAPSFEHTVANAILLGGDTDTIAAMAGAISGAYLGRQGLPGRWLDQLEDGYQGRTEIETLARRLYAVYAEGQEVRCE